MSFAIEWAPAVQHWLLRLRGAALDQILAVLVNVGHTAEAVEVGTSYRLSGDSGKLAAFAAQLADEVTLVVEKPTDGEVVLTSTVAPSRLYRRSVFVQGTDVAYGLVGRAVDAGLQVEAAGAGRWRVLGPSAGLMAWLAEHAHAATLEQTLKEWGVTAAEIADEDATAPAVRVVLPDRRRSTTAIERNDAGDIVRVDQLEEDA